MTNSVEALGLATPGSVGPQTQLAFTLNYWCLWQSEEAAVSGCWPGGEVLPYNGGSADVSFLPVMQRRRLSPLAGAACAVAWRSRCQCGDMPAVFFSSHGESQYYFEMLQELAGGQRVSPSRFSLCVHNAIAGLSSLHSESFLPYISLAGGTEGMFAAFLEAGGLLTETSKVLLVCYEQSLPEIYRPYVASSPNTWALAMVLARADEPGHQLRLVRESVSGGEPAESGEPNLLQAILEGRRRSCCNLGRSIWHWSLDDA